MNLRSLFPALFAALLWILLPGCATPSREAQIESRLAASGFKVIPATTPKQVELVQQLAPGQLTLMNRNGQEYYVYPDAAQKQLYVGQLAQYQAYQARVEIEEADDADARAARQSVMDARNNDLPEWNNGWGSWAGNAN